MRSSDPHAVVTSGKKPYETPRLTTYGTIREVTNAVGYMGMMDGGRVITFMFRTA
jgi:hypothetical protein